MIHKISPPGSFRYADVGQNLNLCSAHSSYEIIITLGESNDLNIFISQHVSRRVSLFYFFIFFFLSEMKVLQ